MIRLFSFFNSSSCFSFPQLIEPMAKNVFAFVFEVMPINLHFAFSFFSLQRPSSYHICKRNNKVSLQWTYYSLIHMFKRKHDLFKKILSRSEVTKNIIDIKHLIPSGMLTWIAVLSWIKLSSQLHISEYIFFYNKVNIPVVLIPKSRWICNKSNLQVTSDFIRETIY